MKRLLEHFSREADATRSDEGAVAIEYVLVAGFVAVGVGVVFTTTTLWQDLSDKLATVVP